jgi:hypothetical protein
LLISKRLAVWFLETVFQALLLGLSLSFVLGHDRQAFFKDALIYGGAISFMFLSAGYLVTTGISRAFWNVRKTWTYSVLAAALFLVHFEIMNVGVGGAFESRDRWHILLAGTIVAFLCSLFGSAALKRWTRLARSDFQMDILES